MLEPYSETNQSKLNQIDILVVDDTPENLRLLATMLERQGYSVRKAINGAMALTAVKALPPDLILLDIMMPEMDGYEVCQSLKQHAETQEIPVIFLSALDDAFDKVRAFKAGGSDYITKPFHIEEVMARVRHHIALRLATLKVNELNAQLEARVQERTRQLEAAHIKLVNLALRDSLTELPNRIAFLQLIEEVLQQSKSDEKYDFAVLVLDCDRFKIINDSLGHDTGDLLLLAIAQRLKKILTEEDKLARLGGDEFAILLTQRSSLEVVKEFANQILCIFTAPFPLNQQTVFINASLGLVMGSADYQKSEHLLRDADAAMYQAKASGKARYCVFERVMHDLAFNQLQLEIDLRKAIQSDELTVYYQPIVSLQTGRIMGLEALVRWQHPSQGFISPAHFIPIAEETQLINQIGQLVLYKACHQIRQWQVQGVVDQTFSVSVNLSARQFAQPDLINQIARILDLTKLEPTCLKLEVTESAIMDNLQAAAEILHCLRSRQIQLSMDDFGTGYSSLNYLRLFPMDNLKIDRSFIQGLDETTQDLGLVPIIVAIAQKMNMRVIAEGIETAVQLQQLRNLHCDYGQGFYFSKPLPAEQIFELLVADKQW